MQNYPHVIESCDCILKIFICNISVVYKLFNLFWNMFSSESMKILSYYHHSHKKLSNGFLLIFTHRDL